MVKATYMRQESTRDWAKEKPYVQWPGEDFTQAQNAIRRNEDAIPTQLDCYVSAKQRVERYGKAAIRRAGRALPPQTLRSIALPDGHAVRR